MSHLAIWEWDVPRGTMRLSSGAAELLGEGHEELSCDPAWWSAHLEDDDARREVVARALRGEASRWTCPLRVRRRDGRRVPLSESGFVARDRGIASLVVGVLRADDAGPAAVDEAASLLARYQHSERPFRDFVDSLPQLAWMTDAQGWVQFYNRRWYDYTGSSFEQMEGWGWIAAHDPNDLHRTLRILRNALQTGQPWEDEVRLRRASDGMMRWHLSRAMPVRDGNGRVVRWFGTNTDVHDQKLASEAYSRLLASEQRLRRDAEASSHAKDEFLALVSHELRTPLNAILGWSQLLTRRGALPEKVGDGLAKIERNARAQARLVEDLLDVSRIISGKIVVERMPTVLGEVVAEVVEEQRPAAESKGVTLSLRDESRGALVAGSAGRLAQMIGNLLSNAVKFTERGGRVEVDLEVSDGMIAVCVQDTGIGIAPEVLPHVFERFRQADSSSTRKHGGLGLGLNIVYELARLHGGDVSVKSRGHGEGAAFLVRLPVLSTREAAPRERPAPVTPSDAPSLAGVKVLAVDDSASAREVLAATLLACEATVTLASSVYEALRSFKLDPPDVVVSDIAMPELDGYALVERIRALPDPAVAGTPVVALTAYASQQDRDEAIARGFDAWIAKPLDAERLAATIAALVRARALRM